LGPEYEGATRPVGSWIAGLTESAPEEDVQTLRSDRQGVATTEIEHLFGEKAFNFPKPMSLTRALVRSVAGEGDIVLDFFAGSGTTGHATLALNAEDDADRRFILVSSTEVTKDEPDKNLCRDVCAQRLRKAISGDASAASPLPGDFAYLHARRVDWNDVLYELDHAAVWILIQLRYDRSIQPFDPETPVQVSRPDSDHSEEPTVIYVPEASDIALARIRKLADTCLIAAHSPTPGLLRDRLSLPVVSKRWTSIGLCEPLSTI
jgi:adenine-specific DNA-methyltransferase